MQRNLFFLAVLFSLQARAQLMANIMIPSSGVADKQQLWNILIVNTGTSPAQIRIQANLTSRRSGQPVFSATTGLLTIPTGTKQLNSADVGPVQYNALSNDFRIDNNPSGFLPLGEFTVCYDIQAEYGKTLVHHCQSLVVEPLVPLLLNTPNNGSSIGTFSPTFSWLPFTPAQLPNNLNYSIKLTEMTPGQSAADAMEKNIPFFTSRSIEGASFQYVGTYPALNPRQRYAWQVTASSGEEEIAASDVWSFSIEEQSTNSVLSKPFYYYSKLKKESEGGSHTVFFNDLQFEYLNETSDSLWNIVLKDITSSIPVIVAMPMLDTLKMVRGENMIFIPGATIKGLKDKHVYLMKLTNSRNEVWQLKFEFRKEEEN